MSPAAVSSGPPPTAAGHPCGDRLCCNCDRPCYSCGRPDSPCRPGRRGCCCGDGCAGRPAPVRARWTVPPAPARSCTTQAQHLLVAGLCSHDWKACMTNSSQLAASCPVQCACAWYHRRRRIEAGVWRVNGHAWRRGAGPRAPGSSASPRAPCTSA